MSSNEFSIKASLKLITGLVLIVLLVVGSVGVVGVRHLANSANDMGMGKDVVADILPPPLFVIEAQLVAYDIASASAQGRAELLTKFQQLQKDYQDRNQFWELSNLDTAVKGKLLGEQRRYADLFWKEANANFLPAVSAGDQQRLESSLKLMRQHYDAHRAGVENTVVSASQFAESTLNDMGASSQRDTLTMLIVGAVGLLLVLVAMNRTSTAIICKVGGEPDTAAQAAGRIAQGDLNSRIDTSLGNSGSVMHAMSQMQSALREIVGDIGKIVQSAERGDFSQRMDVRGRQGFGLDIGNALNRLMQVSDTSLQDIARVSMALADGKLDQRVDASYPGTFGQTANAVNATVDALKSAIEDVRHVVDAAAQGDFSRHLDASSRKGYTKELVELLNTLSLNANEALSDISRVAQSLAEGDLRKGITKRYPGLFGETADAIDTTVTNLQELIRGVVEAVETINTASQEISAGNNDLSARTETQASSLEETASSMEQVTSMVQQNTHSAQEVSERAKAASLIAANGGGVVKATVVTMEQIQESSRKIREIISVIDGIAFQTNILALNAAVEAARAGEQGKGFAVVATEVRSLAQRSAQAAKEIATLISDSVEKVERGTEQAEQAGRTMDQIVKSIGQVTEIAVSINDASKEQAAGIEGVSRAVAQMDQGTQQNAALVEQAAAAAESLAEQAQQLQSQVQAFRF
jgi:methyl-accepting chemotaxis protein